ncbi:efflux RND transporter periplasmic adaptor subunit [Belliella pelovolcani]|uniref:Multidrug efflux pump subunit AcrA (Membrane-fusion protein) n=1 Tax=Belliella pelovolcani TaxID=529505 RepID=A0A1N7LIF7_9BACT|nr:efflux RND transporter periplasmic adaptor subunit [Belliella pelovolcani]SIS73592.1 Multidrug efflux pump subunit AcrA (membrane-fusion protein) [Belliella pelovolcani]
MKRIFPNFIFICGTLFACSTPPETTFPIKKNISESVFASGLIKAKNQYRAFANTNGILSSLSVEEGELVEEGQILLEISNESTKLSRETAELAREFADRRENELKIKEVEVSIEFARIKFENDSLLLSRQENLWKQGIGTANDLEQRRLNFQNSKTQYLSAQLRYRDFKRELEFNERNASKNLAISKSVEGDLSLRSKIAGKVYALLVEKGEMVNPQTPLAIIGSADEFILEMQVDEYDVAKVKEGQRILVKLDSYRGEIFEAVLRKINPIMDERTKSFTVEAEFVQKPDVLYPNLNFEANILIQAKENVLTIPRNYLIQDRFVLAADGDTLEIQTGLKDYQLVEVLGGINEQTKLKKPFL